MPHVLAMSARQLGHPVPLVVLMKPDDRALHGAGGVRHGSRISPRFAVSSTIWMFIRKGHAFGHRYSRQRI
jgi:hypothetical protein